MYTRLFWGCCKNLMMTLDRRKSNNNTNIEIDLPIAFQICSTNLSFKFLLVQTKFLSFQQRLFYRDHLLSYPPRNTRSKDPPCTSQRSTSQPLRSQPSLLSPFGLETPTSPCQLPKFSITPIVSNSRGKPSHRSVVLYEYLPEPEQQLPLTHFSSSLDRDIRAGSRSRSYE